MSIQRDYATQIFQQHLDQYPPDTLSDEKLDELRQSYPIPSGISKRDQEVLISVRKGYHFLDEKFHIFGLYFGWSFIFAFFVPIIGPTVDCILSYKLVIHRAEQAGIPKWLKAEMMQNMLLGVMLSLVPFVGRIVSAMFGPNSRNEMLFEEYLRVRGYQYGSLVESGVVLEEYKEGNGEWWKVFLDSKAGEKAGFSKEDVEMVRPGAGMTAEEVKLPVESLVVPVDKV